MIKLRKNKFGKFKADLSIHIFLALAILAPVLSFADIVIQRNTSEESQQEFPLNQIQTGFFCSSQIKNERFFRFSSQEGETIGQISQCMGDTCKEIRKVEFVRGDNNEINVHCLSCEKASADLPIGHIVWPTGRDDLKMDRLLESKSNFSAAYFGYEKREERLKLNCVFKTGGMEKPEDSSLRISTTAATTPARADLPSAIQSMQQDLKAQNKVAATEEEDEQNPEAQAQTSSNSKQMIVCTREDGVIVRDSKLSTPLFDVYKGEAVIIQKNAGKKSRTIRGIRHAYVSAKFPSKGKSGWISEQYVSTRESCNGGVAPAPSEPRPPVKPPVKVPTPTKPKPAPVKPEPPEEVEEPSRGLLAPNCARSLLLQAAKTTVRKRWGNRSYSGGQCALGVRQALQASGVGGIQGGIGHAIDFKSRLTRYGYVDTGIRDPRKAPPGAVIVFDGPNTSSYLRTGRMSRPYGNYVGHVAIKGDDGFYYTDGKTAEPAIGWSSEKNRSKIRNVVAIMVPNERMIRQYVGRCKAMK